MDIEEKVFEKLWDGAGEQEMGIGKGLLGRPLTSDRVAKRDADNLKNDSLSNASSNIFIFEEPIQKIYIVIVSYFPPFFAKQCNICILLHIRFHY